MLPYLILLAVCHASAHSLPSVSADTHAGLPPGSIFLFLASPVGRVLLPALFLPFSLPDHQFWSLKSGRSLETEPLAFLPPHTRSRSKVGAAGPRRDHYRPFIVSELRSSFCSAWKQRPQALLQPRLCERKHSPPLLRPSRSQAHIPALSSGCSTFLFSYPPAAPPAEVFSVTVGSS